MGRVNVFLKDKLLDAINKEVKEEGTNRTPSFRRLWRDTSKLSVVGARRRS